MSENVAGFHGREEQLDFVQARHEEIAAFAATAHGGTVRPDVGSPGLGLEFKRADAERHAV